MIKRIPFIFLCVGSFISSNVCFAMFPRVFRPMSKLPSARAVLRGKPFLANQIRQSGQLKIPPVRAFRRAFRPAFRSDELYGVSSRFRPMTVPSTTFSNLAKAAMQLSQKDSYKLDLNSDFISAVKYGDIERASSLLDLGANIDYVDPASGWTALVGAISNSNISMVEFLIRRGANPNLSVAGAPWPQLTTFPLLEAVRKGEIAILRLLLEFKANPNQQNEDRENSLMAAFNGEYHLMSSHWERIRKKIIILLLENGAHPNCEDKNGITPLMKAVTWRDHSLVESLLEQRASVGYRNQIGESVFDFISEMRGFDPALEGIEKLLQDELLVEPKEGIY